MKTAVQIAVEKLEQFIPAGNQLSIRIILDEALKKEKEQIEEAFRKGRYFQAFGGSNVDTYYTETYKNQTP